MIPSPSFCRLCKKLADEVLLTLSGDLRGLIHGGVAAAVIDCSLLDLEQTQFHGPLGGHIVVRSFPANQIPFLPQPLKEPLFSHVHAILPEDLRKLADQDGSPCGGHAVGKQGFGFGCFHVLIQGSVFRFQKDNIIDAVCESFGIREEWLRYGLEPMRAPKSREEEIAELVGAALNGSNDFRKSAIRALCNCTDAELQTLEKLLSSIYEDIQKENA